MAESSLAHLAATVEDRARRPLSPAVAEEVLRLKFSPADVTRMADLADRNSRGLVSPDELAEMKEFDRVGQQLSLLTLRARQALAPAAAAS